MANRRRTERALHRGRTRAHRGAAAHPTRHRLGAALAVFLSGVLVFATATPAGAATLPEPEQTTAAAADPSTDAAEAPTPPPEDAAPQVASPAPTPQAPAPEAPATEAPVPDAPAEPAPADPADPSTPDETTPAAPKPDATEDPGIITPFAAVADCVGGNAVCGTLILTSVVQGGTATVDDWVLRASDVNSEDWYDFTSGQQRRVDKPGSYLLEAIGTPGVTDDYVTTLDCFLNDTTGGTRLQFTPPNALQYIGTGSGSLVASCTFTHTSTAPGILTITKGGERTGAQSVGPLAGATFAVYRGGSATTPDTSPENLIGTCVTGDDGTCDVEVPSGEQYWIIETAAPDGYRVIDSFDVGSGSGVSATPYRLRTAVVDAGETTVYPQPTTGNSNLQARGSQWANAAINPALAQSCGLRVGLLVDLSNSLQSSQQDLRDAAAGFVDALEGTPSSIGIWTFAGSAPAVGAANTTLPLTPVSTAAGASTVRTKAQGLTVVSTGGWEQGTNWDQGLWQVTQASVADTLDVVLVLTDGSPTYYGPPGAGTGGAPAGPGSTTRFREMENAVFSANSLKLDRGTTVVGVGIGPASAGEEQNLQAISGPAQGTDYFLVEDYAALQEFLEERALGECAGTVNVTKLVIPSDGDLEDAAPTAGWTFGATTGTAGVTIDPATAVTNQTGAVSFAASGLASAGTAAVTVTETQQTGYTLVQQGGFNAACQDNNTGTPVTVENSGATGFTTDAVEGAIITCTVYNRAPDPTAPLRVDKAWVVNGQSYADGEQPVGTADLLLDGAAATFGTVYPGYTVGSTVAIGETVSDLPSGCTYTSTGAGDYEIQAVNPNVVTVTNTVTCVTTLTLQKTVANGDATVADFTLNSAPIGGTGLPGPNGTSGTTADVTPGTRYVLSESGPGTYVQTVEEGVTLFEGATGSWDCLLEGTDIDGADGTVTVNLGQEVTCTAVNQTATMVLLKQVVNDEGGTLTAEEWDLTADPGENDFGLQPTTVTGAPNASTANTFAVRPGQEYTLTETDSPTGYRQFALEQLVGATWVEVDPTVTVPALGRNTYRFVNVDVAPRLTLVKEVTNDNGGTATPSEWELSATSPGEPGITGRTGTPETTSVALTGGVPYTLAETEVPGYTWSSLSCDNGAQISPSAPTLTLAVGDDVTCTFVNDDIAPRLTLLKTVTNAQGGTATPTDWTLSAVTEGGPNLSGVSGSDAVTGVEVTAGATYTLAEADGPSGYDWVLLSCDNGAEISPDAPTLVLAPGDDVTCTFGNTDLAGSLTLVKELVNDDGGTAVPSDWDQRLSVQPATGDAILFDHNETIAVPGGTYTLSETEQIAGYEWTELSCTVEGTSLETPTVTVPNGENVTCTFVNEDIAPTLTLVKTVVNDDGGAAAATDWTLTAETAEGVTISGTTGSAEVTAATVPANTEFTLGESGGPDGYAWSSLSCDGGATTSVEDPTLTLSLAQNVTCTYENDDLPGSLTLVKEVVSDDGGTAAPEDWNGALIAQPSGGEAIAFDHATTQPVPAGDYALSEEGGPDGYEWTDLACGPGGTSREVPSVTVANGADVLCTFTNDDIPPTLTLLKSVTNENGGTAVPTDWTLTASSPSGPDLSGISGSADVTGVSIVAGAEYTLGETGGPGGYEWTSLACDNGATVTPQAPTATFGVGEDVTCTFVNTDLPGSLTLEKVVDNALGGSAVPTDWNQRLVAEPASGPAIPFDHAQTQEVSAGTYTLSEVDQLADYEATALECSTGGVTLDSPTVTVANGASVTCTFTNASVGPTLTLVKEVDNGGGIGTATADAWTLNAVAGAEQPTLSGAGTPAAGGASASLSGQVAADADYTLSETFGPSGYTAGDWACAETASGTAVPLASPGVVRLALGTDVTCTIVNTAIPAEGTIDKQVGEGSPTQNADGSWTIAYDIVVTNNSDTSTYIYSLSDALQYGDGITPTTASWTGPGGTSGDFALPAGTAVLATDATLPTSGDPEARATATYTVTVTATVANGTQEGDTWRCDTTPGTPASGGFLNAATLSSADADDQTAYGCGEPVFPTLVKTGTDPATQNPDASWNLAYTLTVSNPGASAVTAALTDTLPVVPDGWVLVGGAWTLASAGGAPAPTTTSGAPGATVPIWTGSLDPGGSVAYEVTGVLRPTADAVSPGPCDTSGGVINTAGVTSGEIVLEAEGCVSVRVAGVTVAKGDGVAQQLPDGDWQIDYTVTVANTSADVATVYTLTDRPDLGEGIGFISGEWVGTAPAPDATLAAGATAEYVFRILASVDITDDPALTCEPGEGGGFYNTVLVAYPGGQAGDDACAEPAVPSVAKVAQEPQPLGGGVWAVAYDVTVSNDSGRTLAYSVEDRPQALPDGVSLVTAWTADGPAITPGGAGSATLTAGWDGDGQPEVATGVIPDGATHTYTVAAQISVDGADPAVLVCGEAPAERTGVWNTARVDNRVGEQTAEECSELLVEPVTLEKSDGSVTSLGDGRWRIDYTVTVTNPGPLPTTYTLTDAPQFDTAFAIAAQGWVGSPNVADVEIEPGGVDTYTYRVDAVAVQDPLPLTALACTDAGGGFFNTATATHPGGVATDSGCAVPWEVPPAPAPPVEPGVAWTGGVAPMGAIWLAAGALTVGILSLLIARRRRGEL